MFLFFPDKQAFVSSFERTFSDGMDEDSRNLTEEMDKEKSNELNISSK